MLRTKTLHAKAISICGLLPAQWVVSFRRPEACGGVCRVTHLSSTSFFLYDTARYPLSRPKLCDKRGTRALMAIVSCYYTLEGATSEESGLERLGQLAWR